MSKYLESILNCNFHNLTKYLSHEKKYSVGFPRNSKLWRWCKMSPPSPSCWSPSFLSPFCAIFPSLTVKIMRLQVETAKPLLEKGLVDKVLLLVRDPRATMESRLVNHLFLFPLLVTEGRCLGVKLLTVMIQQDIVEIWSILSHSIFRSREFSQTVRYGSSGMKTLSGTLRVRGGSCSLGLELTGHIIHRNTLMHIPQGIQTYKNIKGFRI